MIPGFCMNVKDLLKQVEKGALQLQTFQCVWVWDEGFTDASLLFLPYRDGRTIGARATDCQ